MIGLYEFWLPLVLIAVSIPLVVGLVPPNWIYGFRTAKTMSNPQIWYEANRHAGANLIAAGIWTMVLCGGIVGRYGAKANTLLPLVLLVMVLGSAVISLLQLRKM
ncbi:MAG TPA: SdpI family protein [Acidobacteriaceae bacterium]|nr:SdpI family protein [Acidobacteriaceae bacterium]